MAQAQQQEQPQHHYFYYPTNHHHHQDDPSSGNSSPSQKGSSLSSSPSSATSSHASQPPPSPPNSTINALHYAMLLNNDPKGLWAEIEEAPGSDFFDPDNNTFLHIAASVGQLDIIYMLKQKQQHNLLTLPNSKGDLPIHVAARAYQLNAVRGLVLWAEEVGEISMLESENEDKNTAIHVALLNHQLEMAKFFFWKCPKTFYQLNKQGFSPLYLAIKAQCWNLVKDMLSQDLVETYSEAEEQLLAGESIAHAAIIAKNKDIFQMMLRIYSDLLYKTDATRRTPLSYAAYTGFHEGVKYILNTKNMRNHAFKIDQNGYFPIHWACAGGNITIVKEFFSRLPQKTRFLLTNKGQNILHVAAATGKAQVLKYILRQTDLEKLINMKDSKDGNTPFHLATKENHPKVVYALTWDKRVNLTLQNNLGFTALDIAEGCFVDIIPSFQQRLIWLSLRYAGVPRASQLHYLNILDINDDSNNSNTNPHTLDVDLNIVHDQQTNPLKNHYEMKHKNKDSLNTLLIVSSLVTIVTYASSFTVPGTYNEDTASLSHKCAFQIFVISNIIAMYASILAAVTLIWAHLDDLKLMLLSLNFALPLLGTSLAMMSVAFTAGLYVVLYNVVSWLGIVVLVMGGLFLGALFVLLIPLCLSTCFIRNRIWRYVFHVPFTIMLLACEIGGKNY